MRLALMCDDPAMNLWLDAMMGGSAHQVVVAVNVSPLSGELLQNRPGIRRAERWEDLLIARDIDAILVGGHNPAVLEATKQLASAGHAIVFLPDAAQGSTFLYELSLIRDDNRVQLIPALWHRHDLALVRLRELLRDKSLGAVKLVQMERTLSRTSGMESLSQAIVDAELLPDIDLLRWLGGDYNLVTALRTGAAQGAVLMQTVTLAGRELPEATWQIKAAPGFATSTITIHAEQGRVVAELDPSCGEWVLTEPGGAKVTGNRIAAAREQLDEMNASLTQGDSATGWPELIKDFETLDATQRSVTRRRTVELHFESMSERATFKTQMMAIGCGVLLATPFFLLIYLAVGSFVPPAPAAGMPSDGWEFARGGLYIARALVFAPVAVFLVLQLLYLITRPASSTSESEAAAKPN